jgi:hypothetical protein
MRKTTIDASSDGSDVGADGLIQGPQAASPALPFAVVTAGDGGLDPYRDLKGRPAMSLYELRTYTLYVGKMAEAVKLYQEFGYPALQKGGHDRHLVGYFQGDTGTINQIVHLWKFADDAERREHWKGVFSNPDFMDGFAAKFRPLVMTQEVKLLNAAPWGPHP